MPTRQRADSATLVAASIVHRRIAVCFWFPSAATGSCRSLVLLSSLRPRGRSDRSTIPPSGRAVSRPQRPSDDSTSQPTSRPRGRSDRMMILPPSRVATAVPQRPSDDSISQSQGRSEFDFGSQGRTTWGCSWNNLCPCRTSFEVPGPLASACRCSQHRGVLRARHAKPSPLLEIIPLCLKASLRICLSAPSL